MIPEPDYKEIGNMQELQKLIWNGFQAKIGWTILGSHTIYCEQVGCYYGDLTLYKVYAWNRTDILEKLKDWLTKPLNRT